MNKVLSIAGGIITLIILLTGTGAVAFYSDNSSCDACHEMQEAYKSWKVSTHNSVTCTSCHRRDSTEGMITTKGTAINRIYAHFTKAKKDPKAYVSKENCLRCHASIKKAISESRDSNVINPHPVHLAAGFVCTNCHKRVVHTSNITEDIMPQMKDCISCHRRKEVTVECKACHYGTQQHIDKIAQLGGYTLKKDEDCKVCHTNKNISRTNHKKAMKNIGGYTGIETCSKCHVYAAKGITDSVHSRLKTKVAHIPSIKEEKGMASRAANPMVWANQYERKDGSVLDTGCGKCHVGGSNVPTAEMASDIDCLICHAKDYDMKKRKIITVGDTKKWVGDNSLKAAVSVGKPVASNCWRCHEDHLANTRGTPFTVEADVHAKVGLACQSCHVTVEHKIAKGQVADMMANDIPELALSCTSCHVDFDHGKRDIDVHLKRFACQTCHISKPAGLVLRDRTVGVDKDKDGIFDDKRVNKDEIDPTLLWFNGSSDEDGKPIGSRSDKKSKIYPYKVITEIWAINPETKEKVNGSVTTYQMTGNYDLAVKKLAQIKGLPEAPKWVAVEIPKFKQLNHAIKSKGLECDDCHSKNGLADFKALGYSETEIKSLTKTKSYK